jgi:single-stranded-DNA-specific exonuclease
MNTIFKKREERPVDVSYNNFGLSDVVLKILTARGYHTEDQIKKFLYPSELNLHEPFLLSGMRELVERLYFAMQNNETVVIYGDYDVDGICATAILSDYLANHGVNVYPYIPDRHNDGYGLNEEALIKIIENCMPDLIISCDCGISAREEVELIIDLGVDVIVTDHHEVPQELPQCIVVNPKLKGQEYPFDMLCGTGVALKVVQALGGLRAASKYYDLCALATVADLVPLVDENRSLVVLGLKQINSDQVNIGLKMLCQYLGLTAEITSSDLAYKISPRINAAGRMGDANRAFELLTIKDRHKLMEIIKDICLDNQKRRDICDELRIEALDLISEIDLINQYAIILHHAQWEKGLTSILAAQISTEYHRPTFLLVDSGDSFKGTARSIEGINLYEVLSSVSDIMLDYGGHSQAAGFSLKKEHLEEFKKRINEYIKTKYDKSLFLPYSLYDLEIEESQISLDLIKELELLEPYGFGNPRPIFKIKTSSLTAEFMKNKCNHLLAQTPDENTIVCFGYGKFIELMNVEADFELGVELSINKYRNKEYPNIMLKDINFSRINSIPNPDKIHAQALKLLIYNSNQPPKYDIIKEDDLGKVIDYERLYGTLVLTYDFNSYKTALEKGVITDYFVHNYIYSTTPNNYNRITIGSDFDIDFGGFDRIIFLEKPVSDQAISYINQKTDAKVYILDRPADRKIFEGLSAKRESFVRAYAMLQKCNQGQDNFFAAFYDYVKDGIISYKQLMFCLVVFLELGLLKVDWQDFCIYPDKTQRANLEDSTILNYIRQQVDN